MKSTYKAGLLAIFLAASTQAGAATVEELDARLKNLETSVEINREVTDDAAKNAAKGLQVAGYSTAEYVTTDAPGRFSGFRLRHFDLTFKKQVNQDLSFYAGLMFEDAPLVDRNTGANAQNSKLLVEAVNFNYRVNPETTLRVGRFFTPAGIWSLDSIPFVLTQDRPLHIRQIFPQVIDGVTVGGVHGVGNAYVSYDAFIGNGQTTQFDGNSDYNSNKGFGGRVNVALPALDRLEFGATVYSERMKLTAAAAETNKNAYGVHAQAKQGAFTVRGEYTKGKYEPIGLPATNYNRIGYYIQPSYDINKLTVGYRYDHYNPNTATVASSQINEHVPFVAYHMDANTTIKWEHHMINNKNPATKDFYRSILSIAVNFE